MPDQRFTAARSNQAKKSAGPRDLAEGYSRDPEQPIPAGWGGTFRGRVLPVTDSQAPPFSRSLTANWRVGPWDRSADWLLAPTRLLERAPGAPRRLTSPAREASGRWETSLGRGAQRPGEPGD